MSANPDNSVIVTGKSDQTLQTVLSDKCDVPSLALLAVGYDAQITSQATLSLPLFQLVARGHPPRGDNVCPVSLVVEERRRPAVQSGHRHLPRGYCQTNRNVVRRMWIAPQQSHMGTSAVRTKPVYSMHRKRLKSAVFSNEPDWQLAVHLL